MARRTWLQCLEPRSYAQRQHGAILHLNGSNDFFGGVDVLTFSGGIIGIILGWLTAVALSKFAGYQSQVTVLAVVLAFGVSAVIGIVFGYYPARRAAGLNPIEALRYE